MKKQSLLSNYLYQFLYQALIFAVPLVLSPYLARTLREEALGTYTYVNSIACYFVVAANLGIEVYGKRVIAQNAEDRGALPRTFWSLFTLHIVISLALLLAYFAFIAVWGGPQADRTVYRIEALYVLSALFDITWLFYGLEIFSSVVIKNALVKTAECVLVFLLVKSPADLGTYTWISAGGVLAGQMILLPQALRLVRPARFSAADMRRHIRPLFTLAIMAFSVTLYTVFDKTLLGLMSMRESVAYYEYSHKIILVPLTLTGVLAKVLMPRACRLVALGREAEQGKYMRYSLLFTTCISMGALFGLWAVSQLFARVYYGPAFAVCGTVIAAMAPLVYIIGIGSVLRSQYIIPHGMDRQYTICILLNAVINLVLNLLLIPVLGLYGAVIGSLAAELFGLCYQMVLCRSAVPPGMLFAPLLPFAGIGALMFALVRGLSALVPQTLAGLLAEIAFGAAVYMALSCLYIRRCCPNIAALALDGLRRFAVRKEKKP